MKTVNTNLLTRIYQNAKIGTLSIEEVFEKLEDPELKELVSNQQTSYQLIVQECEMIARSCDYDLKDNNAFTKIKQTMMIGFSTLTDKSTRHIAEMMLLGSFMGIVDMIKALYDYACADEDILKLGKKLQVMQEKYIESLKAFLK